MKTIIFVPGYYGSMLLDADSKESIWISLRQALLNKNTLAVPLSGVEIPGTRELIAGPLLEQVTVFMAYGRTKSFLQKLAREKNWRFQAVTYDWRKDPREGLLVIDQAVQKAKTSDKDEVYLIGHSQGAWFASYYLRFGTQDYFANDISENWAGLKLVDKVILAAAPFRGTMSLLRNTFFGIQTGPNQTLQSPLAFASMPSTYYFLPPKERMLVLDEKLQPLLLPLHQAEFWQKHNLGFFQPRFELSKSAQEAAFQFLTKQLAGAAKFHALNLSSSASEAPQKPLLYISGHGHATNERGVRHENQFLYYPRHIKKFRPDLSAKIANVDGDGTVSSESQELPPAFLQLNPHVEKTRMSHLELLHSAVSQKQISEFLMAAL